jgi:hypothetical protein
MVWRSWRTLVIRQFYPAPSCGSDCGLIRRVTVCGRKAGRDDFGVGKRLFQNRRRVGTATDVTVANYKEAPQFPSGYRRFPQDASANFMIRIRAASAAKHKLCDPSDFGFYAQSRLFKSPILARAIWISAIRPFETPPADFLKQGPLYWTGSL